MGILPECDLARRLVEKPLETRLNACGLLHRTTPLFVDELRSIEPRARVRFEPDVRPCLVRVSSEQEPLRDAEARVVNGERGWQDHRAVTDPDHRDNKT